MSIQLHADLWVSIVTFLFLCQLHLVYGILLIHICPVESLHELEWKLEKSTTGEGEKCSSNFQDKILLWKKLITVLPMKTCALILAAGS